jgi:Tol biopolymer transport system component
MVVPAAGGAETKVAEFDVPSGHQEDQQQPVPAISWTRDGRSLAVSVPGSDKPAAISLVAVDTGALRQITKPPDGIAGDISPAVSPDGKTLAFVRAMDRDRADIYLCDLNGGGVRALTFEGSAIRGLAWTPGSSDIVYAGNRMVGWRLWRVPAYGGSPRALVVAGNQAVFPAVAPTGNLLAFASRPTVSEIWQARIPGDGRDAEEHPLIRSAGWEHSPSYSPDGKRIADLSDQSGDHQVWISDADGGNRVQITRLEGKNMREVEWSPDGKNLLCAMRSGGSFSIYVIPANPGGRPKLALSDVWDAAWSNDGKSLYYANMGAIWKAASDGSDKRQISQRRGGWQPRESADGKYVYYQNRRGVWRVASGGGDGEEVFVPEYDLVGDGVRPAAKGIYYMESDRAQKSVRLTFYDFQAAKSRVIARLHNVDFGGSFSIAPAGDTLLYSKVDRDNTNISLVENFR